MRIETNNYRTNLVYRGCTPVAVFNRSPYTMQFWVSFTHKATLQDVRDIYDMLVTFFDYEPSTNYNHSGLYFTWDWWN